MTPETREQLSKFLQRDQDEVEPEAVDRFEK